MLLDLEWAGYLGREAEYAQPQAAVRLSRDAVKGLKFTDHTLTEEERAWASAKFARDWNRIENREILLVGAGAVHCCHRHRGRLSSPSDASRILKGNVHERCVRYAINAVTRLTKKDLRDITGGTMNIENTRGKILDLLGDELGHSTAPDTKVAPNHAPFPPG